MVGSTLAYTLKELRRDGTDVSKLDIGVLKETFLLVEEGKITKEAVADGSLDRLAGKISKNTKTLDLEFLNDINTFPTRQRYPNIKLVVCFARCAS